MKNAEHRKPDEIERVAQLLKKSPFFKNKQLKQTEFEELASHLT
jgi:hypothetical protein